MSENNETNIKQKRTSIAENQRETKKKPIGTVFIAVERKKEKICNKFVFRGGRKKIQKAECE